MSGSELTAAGGPITVKLPSPAPRAPPAKRPSYRSPLPPPHAWARFRAGVTPSSSSKWDQWERSATAQNPPKGEPVPHHGGKRQSDPNSGRSNQKEYLVQMVVGPPQAIVSHARTPGFWVSFFGLVLLSPRAIFRSMRWWAWDCSGGASGFPPTRQMRRAAIWNWITPPL